MVEPPSFYGIVPGTNWTISAMKPNHVVVFAANDEDVLRAMILDMKLVWLSMDGGDIEEVTPDSTAMARFRFTAVVEAPQWLQTRGIAGKILAPKEPFSEFLWERLAHRGISPAKK
jgi:hypothetical protein